MQVKMSPQRYAALMKYLAEGQYNARALAELTGLHYITVLDYTRALHEAGVIHICGWERDAIGRDAIIIYKLGPGQDVPKRVLSRTEQQRRYRARKAIKAQALDRVVTEAVMRRATPFPSRRRD